MEIEERYTIFTQMLSAMARSVNQLKTLALKEFGIHGSNVNCLFFLRKNPEGLTLTELSGLCQEDKAAVSRCLQELRDKELVSVAEQSPKRYRARFRLTEKGLAAARRLHEVIRSSVISGGRYLTEEERVVFYSCMEKIQGSLQDYVRSFSDGQSPQPESKG